MYIEWLGTSVLIFLAISHLPSTKPADPYKSSDNDSTFFFYEKSKPKIATNKKDLLNSPHKKISVESERRRLEDEKNQSKQIANGDNGTPVYSLLQCNMLTLIFLALAHWIPSNTQYNTYMLIGIIITGTAYTICIYTFIIQKYIPHYRSQIVRIWFLGIQLYYPLVWFISHLLGRFIGISSIIEYSMYLLGDSLGKVVLVVVLHDVMTDSRRSSTKGSSIEKSK